MDDCGQRELAAGYALGALDGDDASRFEAHVRSCETCAADVEAYRDALLVIAHSAEPANPPAALRERILAEVAPRPAVSPRRSFLDRVRWSPLPAFGAGLAAAAAVVLIAVFAIGRPGSVNPAALLGEPVAAEVVLQPSGAGRILVGRDGKAVAQVSFGRAPSGEVYEAWVMPHGDAQRARPAGLVDGNGKQTVVLTSRVRKGDVVGFTIEPAGGSPKPTSPAVASGRL